MALVRGGANASLDFIYVLVCGRSVVSMQASIYSIQCTTENRVALHAWKSYRDMFHFANYQGIVLQAQDTSMSQHKAGSSQYI